MTTPAERHKQDARIQSAALLHYAHLCREKLRGMARNTPNEIAACEQLETFAARADVLQRTYDKLS